MVDLHHPIERFDDPGCTQGADVEKPSDVRRTDRAADRVGRRRRAATVEAR